MKGIKFLGSMVLTVGLGFWLYCTYYTTFSKDASLCHDKGGKMYMDGCFKTVSTPINYKEN